MVYGTQITIVNEDYLPWLRRNLPGESWALLCSSALLVKNDAEDFVAILGGVSGATPNQFGCFGWGLTQRNCDLPNANMAGWWFGTCFFHPLMVNLC
jgi:hypothetical protein